MTSSTKDENMNEYGGAENVMRSAVGGTENPPAMGGTAGKLRNEICAAGGRRSLCLWGKRAAQRPIPGPEAAVYGFRVLQGPAVAVADAVEHGGAGILRRLRYPQASALDHLERADR
jgi:hypothetical protein